MTLEEIRKEAYKHGYILKKANGNKLLPCSRCGHNRRDHVWCGENLQQIKLVCKSCGYESQPANSKYKAELNWNSEMKQYKKNHK